MAPRWHLRLRSTELTQAYPLQHFWDRVQTFPKAFFGSLHEISHDPIRPPPSPQVHNSDVHGTIYFLRPEVLGAHDGGGDEDIRGTASPRFAFHAAELAMDPEKSLSLRKISKWVPDRCELLVLNTSGAWEDHDADAVDLVVLSRELHACGVGNCVLGQWPVQQRSACVTLWAAFYNERMKCEVEDDLALAICLQKAMLSTKAKYPHWLHWACWALYQ